MIPGSVSFRLISKNWHHCKVGEELSISYVSEYITLIYMYQVLI